MAPRALAIVALAAGLLAIGRARAAHQRHGGLRKASESGPWRAMEDARRIQAAFEGDDGAGVWSSPSRTSVGHHRYWDSSRSDPAEELSKSAFDFEKYAHDFEKSSTGEAATVAARRQQLELEGNFRAAEDLNPFQPAAEVSGNPIDDLANDALYAAGKWGMGRGEDSESPFRRRKEAARHASRTASMKAETKEENDEFALDAGFYAYDRMVKREVNSPGKEQVDMTRPWLRRQARWQPEKGNTATSAGSIWSEVYAPVDPFRGAKEETNYETLSKESTGREASMSIGDLAAEEAADRFDMAADEEHADYRKFFG